MGAITDNDKALSLWCTMYREAITGIVDMSKITCNTFNI